MCFTAQTDCPVASDKLNETDHKLRTIDQNLGQLITKSDHNFKGIH